MYSIHRKVFHEKIYGEKRGCASLCPDKGKYQLLILSVGQSRRSIEEERHEIFNTESE